MQTLKQDGISAKERVEGLGYKANEKLDFYIEKTKRTAIRKTKLFEGLKEQIINTQKKHWN